LKHAMYSPLLTSETAMKDSSAALRVYFEGELLLVQVIGQVESSNVRKIRLTIRRFLPSKTIRAEQHQPLPLDRMRFTVLQGSCHATAVLRWLSTVPGCAPRLPRAQKDCVSNSNSLRVRFTRAIHFCLVQPSFSYVAVKFQQLKVLIGYLANFVRGKPKGLDSSNHG